MPAIILRPAANGSWSALRPNPNDGVHWDKVVSLGDGKTLGALGYNYYEDDSWGFDDFTADIAITKVRANCYLSSPGFMSWKFNIITHFVGYWGTVYNGFGGSPSMYDWLTNPNTGLAWTKDELRQANGFQAGISIKAFGVPPGATVDQYWLEVYYTANPKSKVYVIG